MKPARGLLKGGRVSEAKYEPPLLSGYVHGSEIDKNDRVWCCFASMICAQRGVRRKTFRRARPHCACRSRSVLCRNGNKNALSHAVSLWLRLKRQFAGKTVPLVSVQT